MRGVASARGRAAWMNVGCGAGAIGIDGPAERSGVGLGNESRDWHFDTIAVAEIFSPVSVGAFHRFDDEMLGLGRRSPEFAQRIALKDVEHLDQVHAAR